MQFSLIGKILSLSWVVLVILFYFTFQPDTTKAVLNNPYWGAILVLAIIGLMGHFIIKFKRQVIYWRHIYWAPAILALSYLVIPAYYNVTSSLGVNLTLKLLYFSFFSLVLWTGVLVFLTAAWSLGAFVLRKLNDSYSNLEHLKMALGLSLFIFLGSILGVIGQFNFYSTLLLIIISIALDPRGYLHFLKKLLLERKKVSFQSNIQWPAFFLLSIAFTISWISSLKPFPQGNDGATLYLDISNKLTQTGYLPTGGNAQGWSVLMAFGQSITDLELAGVLLSHIMGFLAIAILYKICRRFLNPSYSILAIGLVFLSPYFGFHMIVDEKIDLALLYMLLVICDFTWIYRKNQTLTEGSTLSNKAISDLVIIGWLIGVAFTMKYSSVLFAIALIPLLTLRSLRQASGYFLLFLSMLLLIGIEQIGGLVLYDAEKMVAVILTLIAGVYLIMRGASITRSKLQILAATLAIVGVMAIIPFVPWAKKNLSENGSFSVSNLLSGQEERAVFLVDPFVFGSIESGSSSPVNQSPLWHQKVSRPVLMSLQSDNANQNELVSSSRYEELQRYLGFESGFWRYASLPTDITFSINVVGNRYVQIGFFLLALLPLLLFTNQNRIIRLAIGASFFLWFIFSLVSINEYHSGVSNTDEIQLLKDLNGYQPEVFKTFSMTLSEWIIDPLFDLGKILFPIYAIGADISQGYSAMLLILLLAILLWLSRSLWREWSDGMKYLAAFVLMSGVSWWIFGMGIVWYNLIGFVLIPVFILYLLSQPKKQVNWLAKPFYQKLLRSAILFQFLIFFLTYFTNPRVGGQHQLLFYGPDIEYATNPSFGYSDVLAESSPISAQIVDSLNQNDQAKIYMINTQLRYHIDNSDQRVFEDNFLQTYDGAYQKHGKSIDFGELLVKNNFKYVLIDLHTPSLDKTPERSLVSKTRRFIIEMMDSPDVQLLLTDNYVEDESGASITLPNGQRSKAKADLYGNLVYKGTLALFKVKS